MEECTSEKKSHAVTIRVNDLYKWLEVIVLMENASHLKKPHLATEILGPKWLFRGQANSAWEISSSFERLVLPSVHKKGTHNEKFLLAKEASAIIHFRQWAERSECGKPSTTGEWLALMQHYRVPTRLVDFTEVPVLALSFALEEMTQEESDFAVWAVLGQSFGYDFEHVAEQVNAGERKVRILDTLAYRSRCDEFDRVEMDIILSERRIPDTALPP